MSIFFIVIVIQFVFLVVYAIPFISLGNYKSLREKQRQDGVMSLQELRTSSGGVWIRALGGLKVLVLSLDIWPFQALVLHLFVFAVAVYNL
jgi:hypothetical protein